MTVRFLVSHSINELCAVDCLFVCWFACLFVCLFCFAWFGSCFFFVCLIFYVFVCLIKGDLSDLFYTLLGLQPDRQTQRHLLQAIGPSPSHTWLSEQLVHL